MSIKMQIGKPYLQTEIEPKRISGNVSRRITLPLDYNSLTNKPRINKIELVGDLTLEDLGIPSIGDLSAFVPKESSISFMGATRTEKILNEAGGLTMTADNQARETRITQSHAQIKLDAGMIIAGQYVENAYFKFTDSGIETNAQLQLKDPIAGTNSIRFAVNDGDSDIYIELNRSGSGKAFITGLTAPFADDHAANKKYVDDGLATVSSSIPTAVSQLNNDSGFVDATGAAAAAPVQSVNGSTGDITGLATSSELTDGLAGKQDTLTFDSAPTEDSQNPVTSDGIFDALTGKQAAGNYAAAAAGDPAALRTASIPFGKVDATSTSTAYTATVPGITSLYDGVACYLMNGVVTSASGFTVDINGLGALPVYSTLAAASRATTLFNVNYTLLLVYNSQRVEGGCWDAYYGYDSNTNTLGYQIRTNSSSLPASDKFYRYRLLFTSADGTKWVPANTSTSTNATAARTVNSRPIDPHGAIVYYGTTTAIEADALVTAAQIWQQYTLTLGYSFNRTGAALVLPFPKPIYVKATPQADGSAIIDPDTPYVTALPTTDDGKIYIFLGRTYSATSIELTLNHPVYYFKNGAIRLWTGPV